MANGHQKGDCYLVCHILFERILDHDTRFENFLEHLWHHTLSDILFDKHHSVRGDCQLRRKKQTSELMLINQRLGESTVANL